MTETISRADGLRIIEQALEEHGAQPPLPLPTSVDLGKTDGKPPVTSMVSVFQPRELDGDRDRSDAHIDVLKGIVGTPEKPRYLDPLVIWWGGDRWYVIDGHHRRMAYLQAKVAQGVPVEVFQGTLAEAVARAAALNSKDRLVMSRDEKLDRAWFLTVYAPNMSKAEVMAACTISYGTTGNMRATREKLLRDLGLPKDQLLEMSWKEAQSVSRGEPVDRRDWDSVHQRMVLDWSKRLKKTFGGALRKHPDVFADALADRDRRWPRLIAETPAFDEAVEEILMHRLGELKVICADAVEEVRKAWNIGDY